MDDLNIVTVDVRQLSREMAEVIARAYEEKPDKKDLAKLRAMLESNPELYKAVFDMAEFLRDRIIKEIVKQPAAQAGMKANIEYLRDGLEKGGASLLEKMLIEQVLVCKLHLDLWTYKYNNFTNSGEMSLAQGDFWERRLTLAQKRYLRACEALARIRKLNPALQVNIAQPGSQQVNVAGDLNTPKKDA